MVKGIINAFDLIMPLTDNAFDQTLVMTGLLYGHQDLLLGISVLLLPLYQVASTCFQQKKLISIIAGAYKCSLPAISNL